jgi:3-oxoacyl-[acyl-carrier protein] reductase
MFSFTFTDRAAIVTGAGSGIGLATAQLLLRSGANVVLADINAAAVDDAARMLDPSGDRAVGVRYDSARSSDADAAVHTCLTTFGRLDYSVACAGMHDESLVADMDDDTWRRTIAVNLDGVFYLARAAANAMSEHGGAIVNVASTAGHKGGSLGNAHYGASKGGVLALTRGLAREFWPRVRVNAVSPGLIDTPMMSHHIHTQGESAPKLDRSAYGTPDQVASVIAFLCSEAASFVSGETILVAGTAFMA